MVGLLHIRARVINFLFHGKIFQKSQSVNSTTQIRTDKNIRIWLYHLVYTFHLIIFWYYY
jgi:hypothetical protein